MEAGAGSDGGQGRGVPFVHRERVGTRDLPSALHQCWVFRVGEGDSEGEESNCNN